MYYRIFSKFYEMAAKKMCQDCQDFIKRGSKILDLGCGSGIVAKNFQKIFQAEVWGVDIKDRRIVPIPFQIIDGKSLPFPENYFDIVLISYVLHHSQNPLVLLKEAQRVVKDKILIYEDIPAGIISGSICQLHGFIFNKLFQDSRNDCDFKTEKEWRKIFEDLGLKVIFQKKALSFLVKKKLFVLRKFHSLGA